MILGSNNIVHEFNAGSSIIIYYCGGIFLLMNVCRIKGGFKVEKRFKVVPEFFGGIIKDKKEKSNMSIDKVTLGILEVLAGNMTLSSFTKEYEEEISIEELVEIFIELKALKIINLDADVKIKDTNYNSNRLSSPLRVFYDITYKCNLRCKHCFTDSGKPEANELSIKDKFLLIEQMKELDVRRISIAGGEPFACEDFFPFIKMCRENEIEVSVSTNGTFFDEVTVKALNDYKMKTITVSLDGGTEESNDFVRGKGTFQRVIRGLNNLKRYYEHNYCIKMTLMKTNINDIESAIKLAIETGCKNIKFNCVREDGRAHNNSKKIILDRKEYIYVLREIERLKIKYKHKITIKAPLNKYCDEEYYYIPELGFGCFAGKESICIDALGNVRACSHFPEEFIAGNIRDKSLKDIWCESDKLRQFREFEGNVFCNECMDYNKCRGGCRYRAFLNGDINGIDSYCFNDINIQN